MIDPETLKTILIMTLGAVFVVLWALVTWTFYNNDEISNIKDIEEESEVERMVENAELIICPDCSATMLKSFDCKKCNGSGVL